MKDILVRGVVAFVLQVDKVRNPCAPPAMENVGRVRRGIFL
jgi:hypothetical protein